jgi:hypothetical protein
MSDLREKIVKEIVETVTWERDHLDNAFNAEALADRILALLPEEREPVAWAWYTDEDERWRFNAEGAKPEPHEIPTDRHIVPLYRGVTDE